MAKKSNIDLPLSGTDVVSSAAAVSAVQNRFLNLTGTAATAYKEAMKGKAIREAATKQSRDRVNAYMANFDSYVDVADFNEKEQKAVLNQAKKYRSQYAELATEYEKISDLTSAEAGKIQDQMQAVKRNMEAMRANLESYAKYKIQFADNNKNKLYSLAGENAEKIRQGQLMIDTGFSGINDDGSLRFDAVSDTIQVPIIDPEGDSDYYEETQTISYDGFDYSANKYESPFFKNTDAYNALNAAIEKQELLKGKMTENQERALKEFFINILNEPNAFASLTSEDDFQFTTDFLSKYDASNPNAVKEAAIEIVEYLKSRRGKGIQEEDENIEKRYAPQLASLKAKQGGKASNETTVIESFLIQWDGKQYKVNDRNQGGARIGEFPTYQSLVNNISQLSKQK
jgi:hypothetical protein|tara:strand:+ start:117 stop:1316 length:1200 start_codon:yes stop_codon:yes gene_type:complete